MSVLKNQFINALIKLKNIYIYVCVCLIINLIHNNILGSIIINIYIIIYKYSDG